MQTNSERPNITRNTIQFWGKHSSNYLVLVHKNECFWHVICSKVQIPSSACEDGNEPSGSIKDWEFLDHLSNY
jgi:hypothetical protein